MSGNLKGSKQPDADGRMPMKLYRRFAALPDFQRDHPIGSGGDNAFNKNSLNTQYGTAFNFGNRFGGAKPDFPGCDLGLNLFRVTAGSRERVLAEFSGPCRIDFATIG
jgi:hypothetical protein